MKTLTAFLFAALLVPTACRRETSNVTGTDQPKPVEQSDQGTVPPPPTRPTPPPTTETTPPAQTTTPPAADTTPPAQTTTPPAADTTTPTPQSDTTPWSSTQNSETGAQATPGASDSLEPKSVNPTDREPGSVDTNTTQKDVDRDTTAQKMNENTDTTNKTMDQASTDTGPTVTFEQRDSLKDQMRADLDKLDDKIKDFEARSETVAKLKVQRDQLSRDLDQIGNQTKAGWNKFQAKLSRDFNSLKTNAETTFR